MSITELNSMISERAAALSPYTPGEQPKDRRYIKLNTNENPYPPPASVQEYLSTVEAEELRLYPDPESRRLRRSLANYFGLPETSFFPGNGSDEVLSFIFYALFDSKRGNLLFPEHTYSFYPVYCSFYDIAYRRIPLREDFLIDTTPYLRHVEERGATGIIFPNPNAPTGAALRLKEIEELLNELPPHLPLVIDEAYVDFGAESAIPLIEKYGNLIVVQTFSKNRSLAGMRIGFAVASKPIIELLDTVKNSFNSYPLNRLSQELAVRALGEEDHYQNTIDKIIATREATVERLKSSGWQIVPSRANFIFARHPEVSGKEVYLKLKERGILVRYFGHAGIEDYLRISIGTDEEMEQLSRNLEEILQR